MKKIKVLMAIILAFVTMTISVQNTYATELTTEPTTEAPTTEAPTTEAPIVTEPTNPDPVIEIGEEGIYLNGELLTKEQIIEIMTYYIDLKFGDALAAIGWTAGGLVTAIIGIGAFILVRIKKQTLATRENTAAKGEVSEYSSELQATKEAAAKAEIRAAKSEAMTAVQMDMIYSLMANSTNKNIVQAADKYKDEIQRVLAIKDDINDTKQILETAGKAILNQAVGTAIQEINDRKAQLLASIQPYTDKEQQG